MNTTFIKTYSRHFITVQKVLCLSILLLASHLQASAQWVKIGTGTTSNTMTTYPTPFANASGGQRAQYLYKASELVAAGLKPGWIDSLGFLVTNTNGAIGHTSLKFYVGSGTGGAAGAAGVLTGGFITNPPLRYFDKSSSYLPYDGWNDFKFSSAYYWNGTDNILVGTCFWSGINYRNASVEFTTSGVNGLSRTNAVSSTTSTGIAICDLATGTTNNVPNSRPNIRFKSFSDTCNAKPNAGVAVSAVTEFCLNDDSIALNLSGNSLSNGLSFQWQRSNTPTGPWTNMGLPSTTETGKNAFQTGSTYYRCVVTCTGFSLSDTSAVVYVPQAPPYNCDCASASGDNSREKILNVNLEGIVNSTPCILPSGGYYTDSTRSKTMFADLEPGTEYPLGVRIGSCDTFKRARALKVFIDYNQNTVYEISEMVYANTYSSSQPNPQYATGDFTVPLTAKVGPTTMRIVYGQGDLSAINPCGTYAFGETQDYRVNILSFGKPSVSGRLIVCEHDSVVMNASSVADTPVVFSWTGPGGFTGVGPKITFVDADPSLSGTYYVTATSGGRTSTPLAVEVIVYPKPPIPKVLNENMCQYEADGTLITNGKNVLWYVGPVGGFGDTMAPKLPTHTPNTLTVYLTQTVNGCVSDRGKVVVNVLLKPGPPAVKSPVTYCQLQTPELVATGENLKWYLDSAGGVASTISPIPPTGFPDVVSYYVSQTVNGCESDRARISVIIYEQPNGAIFHTKTYVCQYDTASFIYFGNAPVSYDYKWYTTDGEYVSGGGQGPLVYRFNKAGENVISLYVNNGKCATFRLTDTISVRPAPTAFIDTVWNACVDVPITITIDSATPNIENYSWNWAGGTLTSETENGGPYNVVFSTPGQKTLSLVVTKRTCPSLVINQSFLVHDRPYAKILSRSKVTNYGRDTMILNGNEKICARDTLVFTAWSNPGEDYKYKWSPSYYFEYDTAIVVGDRMRNPAFIRLDVESEFGCKSSDSIYINAEACCDMAFPNTFTPNGDGRNDRFRPIRDGRQDILTFRVVNRWGQVVFESGSTDTEGWDGTFAGRVQDVGVYQYYIKYRCLDNTIYEKKGDIMLVR